MSHRNAVIFDVDGTLTTTRSIWQFIHKHLGTWENAGKQYLQQFLAEQISYEEFAKRDAREWKGVSLETMEAIVRQVEYVEGVSETMRELNARGKRIFVISSGLSVLVKRIIKEFGVIWGIANELEIRQGKLTGEVKVRVPWDGKGVVLEQLAQTFNIDLEKATVVGDSETDISMFQLCGTAIAFNPSSEEVARAATHVVTEQNLRKIFNMVR